MTGRILDFAEPRGARRGARARQGTRAGDGGQFPNVNQLRLTKSAGWPLAKVM